MLFSKNHIFDFISLFFYFYFLLFSSYLSYFLSPIGFGFNLLSFPSFLLCKFRLLIWDLSLSFFAITFSCYMKFSRQYLSCQFYPVKPKHIHMDFINFSEVFLSQVFLRVSITHKAAKNYVNLLLNLFKCFLHMKIRLLLWKETNDESQPPRFRPLGTKAGS